MREEKQKEIFPVGSVAAFLLQGFDGACEGREMTAAEWNMDQGHGNLTPDGQR